MKQPKPMATDVKSEEFKRFEDFARKIMAVPKHEIDKQKTKYERQKTAKVKPR